MHKTENTSIPQLEELLNYSQESFTDLRSKHPELPENPLEYRAILVKKKI